MWMYFLFCLFATSRIAANGNETTIRSQILANGTSSAASMMSSRVSSSLQPYRRNYKRDLLVVLPVMQGNSDLSDFNLQMLYTKTPVTAIIKEHPMNQSNSHKVKSSTTIHDSSSFESTSPVTTNTFTVTTPRIVEKQLERTTPAVVPLTKHDEYNPLKTNFIFTKPPPTVHKLSSKYNNPESFKFGQEVNKPSKNSKPGFAQTDIALPENKWTLSVESSTRGNSFQIFESVEPLEVINLLSLRPVSISVTDRIAEQTEVRKTQDSTDIPNRFTKQPLLFKLPHKKPQKIKLAPQKVSDAELISFTPAILKLDNVETTVTSASTSTSTTTTMAPSSTPVIAASSSATASLITKEPGSTPSTTKSDNELYDTVRYSTLFAESTKEFLPTHSMIPSPDQIAAIMRPIEKMSTTSAPTANNWSTETSLLTSTTTPHIFTLSPDFNVTDVNKTSGQVMETSPPSEEVTHVETSNPLSITKFLDVHFDTKTSLRPLQSDIVSSPSINPSFPTDMLTNDMKDMLVSLGILKSENDSSPVLFATSATEISSTADQQQLFDNLFIQREPITPTIDPNSYTNFKKLPSIDYEQPQVNNDVRDLLSSFGLLAPTNSNYVRENSENSMLTRASRQQKDNSSDSTMEMFDGNMRKTLENLGLLKSITYHDQQHRNEHVFQPSIHLEKLADPSQVEKINSALETVRKLSKSKDAQNLTIEELEQKLRNVTTLLRDENILDANATHTLPELVTKTSSKARTFIFNDTTTSQESTNSVTITSSPLTASFKSIITTANIQESTTTASSVIDTSTGRPSTNSDKNNENNYRRGSSSERTTTTGTTTTTTTTTIMPTTKSSNTSTMVSFSETELNAENSTSNHLDANITETQSTAIPSPLNHNEVNDTSDASYMSMVKQRNITVTQLTISSSPLAHTEASYMSDVSFASLVKQSNNDNNLSVVVSPPPNPLSVEELQNLLESNRNEVKRQQPREEAATTTSSTPSSGDGGDSGSSTSSGNSDNGSSTTAETSIKDEVTNDNDPPLEALADSFGGENNEEQGDSWLANAKPNGLYFLLDWNSFLSVGEEDKNPIRIRFQPRAGNPRNFQPIKVP